MESLEFGGKFLELNTASYGTGEEKREPSYARALGKAIKETCSLLSFRRRRRSHTAASPTLNPLGAGTAALFTRAI